MAAKVLQGDKEASAVHSALLVPFSSGLAGIVHSIALRPALHSRWSHHPRLHQACTWAKVISSTLVTSAQETRYAFIAKEILLEGNTEEPELVEARSEDSHDQRRS